MLKCHHIRPIHENEHTKREKVEREEERKTFAQNSPNEKLYARYGKI